MSKKGKDGVWKEGMECGRKGRSMVVKDGAWEGGME